MLIKLFPIVLISLFILITFQVGVQAQSKKCDQITLQNGDEISAKVIEVDVKKIKYRRCNLPDGPIYTLKKSDVFMIKYPDGSKDVFPRVNSLTDLLSKNKRNRSYDPPTEPEPIPIPQAEKAKEPKRDKKSRKVLEEPEVSRSDPSLKNEPQKIPPEITTPSTPSGTQKVSLQYDGAWFAKDAKLELFWDKQAIGEGTFMEGFKVNVDTEPGTHRLEIKTWIRKYKFDIDVSSKFDPNIYFHYNRMFGTLKIDKKRSRL